MVRWTHWLAGGLWNACVRVGSRLCSGDIRECSVGCGVQESSPRSYCCSSLWTSVGGESTWRQKTISVTCPCSSFLCRPGTKERKGWGIHCFQLGLPVIVVGVEKSAVPLKTHSQSANLTPQHMVAWEKNPEEEQDQEDMAASQVKDESWVRSCACLSSWYDWLKNQQPLFFSLMFLDSEVVLMYLFPFVFMIVRGSSLCTVLLSFFPGPSLHYLYLSCTRSAVAAFS